MAERATSYIPALVLMAGIFAMSSQSTVPQASGISPALTAALGHLVVYAVLAVLIFRAVEIDVRNVTRCAVIAWGISTLYGITDEFHQSFVPGRYATVGDVLLDSAGAAAGLCLLLGYRSYRRKSDTLTRA